MKVSFKIRSMHMEMYVYALVYMRMYMHVMTWNGDICRQKKKKMFYKENIFFLALYHFTKFVGKERKKEKTNLCLSLRNVTCNAIE